MSTSKHHHFFRRAFLAVWVLATLILVFCVFLLAREMMRQGRNPFDLSDAPEAPLPEIRETPVQPGLTKDVNLYFASADGRTLVPELRHIEYSEFTVNNCRAVLEALTQGSQGSLSPVLPASAKIRGLYLLADGELVLDLARDTVQTLARSASAEALMVYGIVSSVTQPTLKGEKEPAVRAVRFLVEGASPSQTFDSHLDFSDAIVPDPEWIEAQEAVSAEHV